MDEALTLRSRALSTWESGRPENGVYAAIAFAERCDVVLLVLGCYMAGHRPALRCETSGQMNLHATESIFPRAPGLTLSVCVSAGTPHAELCLVSLSGGYWVMSASRHKRTARTSVT